MEVLDVELGSAWLVAMVVGPMALGADEPSLADMRSPTAATRALRTAANAPQPAAVQRGNQRRAFSGCFLAIADLL
jgi:hypothetical protein